ncbi:MAG: DUF3108 domain-containing protein [Chitinophagales bacterium]|nr:DUF3108 domain-containing protein [Chitinophagales bacterium]
MKTNIWINASFGLATLFFLGSMGADLLPKAAPAPAKPAETEAVDLAFQHGERLTYKIYYNLNFIWVPAGEVTFQVFDEGNQLHYKAKGETYDSYEWFFTVKDEYDSWVDKNTLLPNYSERSVNEGDYHIFEKISFNQSAKKMTVWRSPKRGEKEEKTEHTVQTDCHDVLSTLYNLRNFDFGSQYAGYSVPFRVFMDKEEYPLKMNYLGKDPNKKVYKMGKYKTLKFQPEVIAGNVFNDDAKMTVWVSDDANRIPLLIESPVSVGSVKMVLKEYWGLKYNFEAKI